MTSKDLMLISQNKDGNYYFGYRVKVQRGIKKEKQNCKKLKISEIIVAKNEKAKEYAKKEGIILKNDK